MRCLLAAFAVLLLGPLAISLLAQRENPPKAVEPEPITSNAPPPNAAARVRFVGNTKFSNRELSAALADPLAAIQQGGLSLPLADDTAYYLGVFYRRHGYPEVDVKYKIQEPYLELDITEGPYYKLGANLVRREQDFSAGGPERLYDRHDPGSLFAVSESNFRSLNPT